MAELKTKENDQDVNTFINSIENDSQRQDCLTTLALMEKITSEKAKMWGDSMIGFGKYHYKYKSGREGDWFITGFAPRKNNFTIYIMPGFSRYQALLKKIGKHKTGSSCLYLKNLDNVDMAVLEELIRLSIEEMHEIYGY